MNNSNPVGWFDIYVTNFERAKQFYEQVFNVTLTDLPLEWGKQALFPFNEEYPNISGALVEKKDLVPNTGGTMVYFETENCLAEEERITRAGGKIIQPKTGIGSFGFISIFVDSEGNTVGLHSMQ